MTATKQDIKFWLETAKNRGATHLIVAVDRFDYENYPVYVSHYEDINKEIKRINRNSMQGIDEVYNMSLDIEEQLNEHRAYNI